MSDNWKLLRGEDDWKLYQTGLANEGTDIASIGWGHGPREYPCLVTSFSPAPNKIVSAYVYPGDAEGLMKATAVPDGVRAAAMPAEVLTEPQEAASQDQEAEPEYDQAVANEHTAAHLLAIVRVLVELGAITPEKYEKMLTAQLATIDQWQAEKRQKLQRGINQQQLRDEFPEQQ
jgi:hypothetical protein